MFFFVLMVCSVYYSHPQWSAGLVPSSCSDKCGVVGKTCFFGIIATSIVNLTVDQQQ